MAAWDGIMGLSQPNQSVDHFVSFEGNDYYIRLKSINYPKVSEKIDSKELPTLEAALIQPIQREFLAHWLESIQQTASIRKDLKLTKNASTAPPG